MNHTPRLFTCLLTTTWVAALTILLSACQPSAPAFKSTDITGANFGGDFTLSDASGRPRTLSEFKGKAVVLFFGFTQCPDVCPTTLAELSKVMKQLGPEADKVQVLFISLDPERDTAEILGKYIPYFDSRFIGLRGTAQQTQAIAQQYKIFFAKVPGNTPDAYSIDHTAAHYIIDPQGRLRLFGRYGQPAEEIKHDLLILLNS